MRKSARRFFFIRSAGGMAGLVVLALFAFLHGVDAQTPAQPSPAFAAQMLGSKLQPYIGCINRHSAAAFQSEAQYRHWAGKAGPNGTETAITGVAALQPIQGCLLAIANAASAQPAQPALEQAGSDYAAALGALDLPLREAADYYERKGYRQDGFAQGRTLHPRLVAGWNRFRAADGALRQIVRTLNDEVQASELAEVERLDGRKLRWRAMTLMAKAAAVQAIVPDLPGRHDLAGMRAAIDAFADTLDRLDLPTGEPGDRAGALFLAAARAYLAGARGWLERLSGKTAFTPVELRLMRDPAAAQQITGSPQRLLRDYNQLVDRFNAGPHI